jgi:CBS domain-containing protein
MSIRDVLVSNIISLNKNCTVGEAMATLKQYHLSSAPVVDENGVYVGKFGVRCLMRALLPSAVTMEGGLGHVDFLLGAMPGIAKKLKKLENNKISDHLDTEMPPLTLETSLPEAMRLLASGGPYPVIDKDTKKLVGVVSSHSVLSNLETLYVAIAARPDEISEDDLALLRKYNVIN